jgi:hypothetical protein
LTLPFYFSHLIFLVAVWVAIGVLVLVRAGISLARIEPSPSASQGQCVSDLADRAKRVAGSMA